jgi:SAM-dependent methyltransferase
MYGTDLAHIHEDGFGDCARRAAPEITALLKRHGIHPSTGIRIVEYGCGGGRIVQHLTQSGYSAIGIDQSAAMIRLARQNAPQGLFRVGSLATSRIPRCDALIAIGEVINYMTGSRRNGTSAVRTHDAACSSFFRRSFEALRPGGVLLFDFMAVARERAFTARSGSDWLMVFNAHRESWGRVLKRHMVTVRKVAGVARMREEVHQVRVFNPETILRALRHAGFRVSIGRRIGRVRLIRGDYFVTAKKI